MKKVITYGTFDMFHEGHYNILKRAKALGDWLIVGVTTDNFDLERGKMNTFNNVMERIEAVRSTGLADQIIIEEYKGQKIDDIQKYDVDIFTVGSDWTGYFDYLKEYCEVVYLPRTEGISSTQIRQERPTVDFGIIGTGCIASKFVPEASFVNNVRITAVYNPETAQCQEFCNKYSIPCVAETFDQLLDNCNAVYVASPHFTHYEYVKKALSAGKNVLCETPFVFCKEEAEELYALAESKGLVLSVALKTAFCPAFGHLVTLIKSGVIGEVVDITVTRTTLLDESSQKLDSRYYGGSMSENAYFTLLPIFKLLGTDYDSIEFCSKMKNGADIYTKAVLRYKNAMASFQVGLGAKSEGNLVVSGTKGYVFVPAPWWKTDFFEVRYEDQNLNKKYFYPFAGEGLRYEIKDFARGILSDNPSFYKLTKAENIAMAKVQEMYLKGDDVYFI